jgi:hypothetical protein
MVSEVFTAAPEHVVFLGAHTVHSGREVRFHQHGAINDK